MKVLLDECVPRKLKDRLRDHDSQTVPQAGFAGKTNGQLLDAAEAAGFHVVLTVDQGFEYEQSVRERSIAIIIFRARTNRLKDLLPFCRRLPQPSKNNSPWTNRQNRQLDSLAC